MEYWRRSVSVGGSVNIFARIVGENGTQTAKGGISTGTGFAGGSGGTGSITVNELGSVLNYPEKTVSLNIKDTYKIDKDRLTYTKLNDIQTEDLSLGSITYETLDNEIATVDSTGTVTPHKIGTTKIKITDLDNKYSTYVIVKVIDNVTVSKIKTGIDFTLVLKENGTVWTYGNNGVITTNEPTQIMLEDNELNNIVDIGAGNKISIALSKEGKVYTWGADKNISEVLDIISVQDTDTKIVAIDANGNNFYALDNKGAAYIWGQGYNEPEKIQTDIKYIDVDGKLLLRRKWISI